MRKILATAALAALVSATPAFAADSDTTQVTAKLDQNCRIISQSEEVKLGNVGLVQKDGEFSYTCNFAGSPKLTFTSQNGGVVNQDASMDPVKYHIYLNDQAPGIPVQNWLRSDQTPQAYTGISSSAPANSTRSPVFKLALAEDLVVAGNYSDTLTITIAP